MHLENCQPTSPQRLQNMFRVQNIHRPKFFIQIGPQRSMMIKFLAPLWSFCPPLMSTSQPLWPICLPASSLEEIFQQKKCVVENMHIADQVSLFSWHFFAPLQCQFLCPTSHIMRNRSINLHNCTLCMRQSMYTRTVSSQLIFSSSSTTIESFQAGQGQKLNVHAACCSAQTVHKPAV